MAETDAYVRTIAVENGLLTLGQALRMTEGPRVLFGPTESCFDTIEPYFQDVFDTLNHGWPFFGEPTVMARLEAFGSYLMDHPEPPWLRGSLGDWGWTAVFAEGPDAAAPGQLSQAAYLGAAAILPLMGETDLMLESEALTLGPLEHIVPYLARRDGRNRDTRLPDLLVPDAFKQILRDWADRRVSVTAPD